MKFRDVMAVWLSIVLFFGLFVSLVLKPTEFDKEMVKGEKLDNCIKLANEIGLDPNDSQRAEFIKNCYNEK